MDSGALRENLKAELTCSMCLGYFTDPVAVQCGHNFCGVCLLRCREAASEIVTCPQCPGLTKVSDLGPNTTRQNLSITAQMLRRHLHQSMVGLTSCDQDGEKERFFSEEDQRVFTDSSLVAPEHKDHQVLPLETAASKGKDQLQEARTALGNKEHEMERASGQGRQRETCLQRDEDTGKHCILSECGEVLQLLKDQEYPNLQRLKEESRPTRVKLKGSKAKLPQQIHNLPRTAFEVEEKSPKTLEADAAPTVPRVRQKRSADPDQALILACKRLRIWASEEGAEGAEPGCLREDILKLAATVRSQDDPVQKCVRQAMTREKATRALTPSLESRQRIRQDLLTAKLLTRQDDRYRLLSKRRAPCAQGEAALPAVDAASMADTHKPDSDAARQTSQTGGGSCSAQKSQLFDITHGHAADKVALSIPATCPEKSHPDVVISNSVRVIREPHTTSEDGKGTEHRGKEEEEDVYDLKYMEMSTPGWTESNLCHQPYTQECQLDADDHPVEETEDDEDEEDENSENHWRNEYPDEEEGSSDTESTGASDEDYGSFSDDESSVIRPRKWNKYPWDVLKEFEYDGFQDFDSE